MPKCKTNGRRPHRLLQRTSYFTYHMQNERKTNRVIKRKMIMHGDYRICEIENFIIGSNNLKFSLIFATINNRVNYYN